MSDQHEPIAYDRYRAEALALRSAAYGEMFRRLRRLLRRKRRREHPAVVGAAYGQ